MGLKQGRLVTHLSGTLMEQACPAGVPNVNSIDSAFISQRVVVIEEQH